jgi:hypothetical protein
MPHSGAGRSVEHLPTEYQRQVRADLVFEVGGTGDDPERTILHVEVQAQPDPGLELRLVSYWAAMTSEYTLPPTQVVILPRGGPYTGRYQAGGLQLSYQVVDLTKLDPQPLLDTDLAPLALQPRDRDHLVEPVAKRIVEQPGKEQKHFMTDLAILMAGRRLGEVLLARWGGST